jgi:predicted negative regulator of RcsB-dependent stress response
VVIAVGGLFGYNQYESSKLNAEVEASVLFETLAEHVNDGELEDAETVAVELVTDYANTAYAAQSRLAMARLYMDKNRDQDAADSLRELLEMRGNQELRNIGRVRLARVLLYQEKAQEVVDLLVNEEDEAFSGLYAEALGDAYAALGRIPRRSGGYVANREPGGRADETGRPAGCQRRSAARRGGRSGRRIARGAGGRQRGR